MYQRMQLLSGSAGIGFVPRSFTPRQPNGLTWDGLS